MDPRRPGKEHMFLMSDAVQRSLLPFYLQAQSPSPAPLEIIHPGPASQISAGRDRDSSLLSEEGMQIVLHCFL